MADAKSAPAGSVTAPDREDPGSSPRAPLSGTAALRRSGVAIASGTLASRITGFARTVIVGVAIGLAIGDPYNTANTVPNILYDLLLGGVLSAVVIPLLVEAARRDDDGGEAFAQQMITMVTLVLLVVSVLAVIFAPQIISPYAGKLHPAQRHLADTFARFFLPQLVFYGAGAVIGAVLNVRDHFAAPMWAPVLNNLIVIGSGLAFYAMVTGHISPATLHGAPLDVLAIGTTAGIVAQTVVLLPILRRAGVHLRPRVGLSGLGLRRDGRFAAWVLCYVIVNQLGYVVITRLANAAGAAHGAQHIGYSVYTYAYVLFSLPYAIVTVTVVTAIFPAMSRSGAAGDMAEVRRSLDSGLRLAGVVLVPGTLALIAFGPLITTIVLDHGHITFDQARLSGAVLAAFAVGLVPFAAFQMQFRAWLAIRDAKTPALINLGATAVNVAADLLLYVVLPARERVVGLAVGFSLAYFVALAISTRELRWRVGDAPRPGLVLRTHVRLVVAAVIATIPAYAVDRLLSSAIGLRPAMALLTLAVSAAVGVVVFGYVAGRLRVGELTDLMAAARRRLQH